MIKTLAILTASTVLTSASDWPQFRGPDRDAIWRESGVGEAFPKNRLEISWRHPIGHGWSSPIVAAGRVFVTDSHLKKPTAKERVYCFDDKTGKELWKFEYPVAYPEWAFTPEQGSGPTATPIAERGELYTIGALGTVHCLNARDGKVIWKKDLAQDYQAAEMSCRPSPLIEGNLLILFFAGKPGASLLALDKRTGKEIWKTLDDHVSSSSPIVVNAAGSRQLIVWSNDSVTSLNPKTGAVFWREAMTTSGNDSIPTPVVQRNRLLISGVMMELDSKKPDAKILWPESRAPTKRILSNTSSPTLIGDFVYSAKSGGELVCLEAATGKEIWKSTNVTTLKSGASIHITPCGNNTYLFTDEGILILARLAPDGYHEISRAKLLEPTSPFAGRRAWVPPAYADRRVFARNDTEIVCANLGAQSSHR